MFEAVKGQDIVVRMLKYEISGGRLPQVLLFQGPEGCGKFLTAVELVRVLHCERTKSSSCTCRSCTLIQNFLSKDMMVVSKADMRNTFTVWRAHGVRETTRAHFLHDLRRLVISRADEPQHRGACEALEDLLRVPEEVLDHYDAIMDIVDDLTRISTGRIIGIDRIREVQRYLSVRSDDGGYRCVILDGAERMNDEASNSFLKISEDTPPHGIIILTSVQPLQIKETIRSRCRGYRFIRLTEEAVQSICQERFHDTGKGISSGLFDAETVEKYFQTIAGRRGDPYSMIEVVQDIVAHEHGVDFLDFVANSLRGRYSYLAVYTMEQVQELEELYRQLEFTKRAVLYHHVNAETALFDFILNNYGKILHYIEGVSSVN